VGRELGNRFHSQGGHVIDGPFLLGFFLAGLLVSIVASFLNDA
jgi:hypothetical protein